MPQFAELSIWVNVAIFAASAAAVWVAGTRLSYLADSISRRTGLGQAALGVLLLGGVTSLPEIAVAGAAALTRNAELAVNNLLGGFAMQVAILALADLTFRRAALTAVIPDPIVLLQGALGVVLLALTVAGIASGDVPFLGAGLWTWGIFGVFLYSLRLVTRAEGHQAWQVVGEPRTGEVVAAEDPIDASNARIAWETAGVALVILAAGFALSQTGEALAEQTGLGSSFFGAVFVAISTSLPEISTVLAAMRLRRYVMAVSDIFGTNLFDVALIFLVDLLYVGDPVLTGAGGFSIVAAALGMLVTALYVVGLIERRDPALFGVGLDSYVVVVAYLGGVGLLFAMR
jgi:cation:H+ antiporter